jgi:carbonic anhydrase/acetyltransferase-like protein (isoleucine patch superfamily)
MAKKHMIPGIGVVTEPILAAALDPRVTDVTEELLNGRDFTLLSGEDEEAKQLGIVFTGGPELTIVVTDPARRLGQIRVQTLGKNNVMFFDNATWEGNFNASIRMLGSESITFFNDIGDGYVLISDLLMRGDNQLLFWGTGATAVSVSLEIEGTGRSYVIGDDALISNGVWIRNYDMHSIHDLGSGRQINRSAVSTVIERHVWLGQDALLLSCERIGMGSIVGARSIVKGEVPPRVLVAGAPARVIRDGTSWGRHPYGMTANERRAIGLTERPGE